MQSSSCFDALPNDVLRRIETSLDVKDRRAFFSCCRAVRAYQVAATGGLWPELKFRLQSPEKTQALADWLARNRQHLGKFQLTALLHPPAEPAQCIRAMDELLAALAGSSVHTLRLNVIGIELTIGGWVLSLPRLESLIVSEGQLITPPVDMSSLTRLTSLRLRYSALPASMPPHLRELSLHHYDARAFRMCATSPGALQELQKLMLTYPSEVSVGWDWLPQLTALTSLSLYHWESLAALPPQLEALTGLRRLQAGECFQLPPTVEALEPLSALAGLTSLSVFNNGWRRLPPCVFALPLLKELEAGGYIRDAGLVVPDIPLAGSTSLTRLSLTAGMALGAADQLRRFPALHTLALSSLQDLFQAEEQHEVVGRLLGELKRLPKFEFLHLGCVAHGAFRRFMEFLRVLNLEYPYRIHVDDERGAIMD